MSKWVSLRTSQRSSHRDLTGAGSGSRCGGHGEFGEVDVGIGQPGSSGAMAFSSGTAGDVWRRQSVSKQSVPH